MADAAYAIRHCLGMLKSHRFSPSAAHGVKRHFHFGEHDLDSAILRKRIGADDLLLLRSLIERWSSWLREVAEEESLIHGDFNHRNIILDRKEGCWKVVGILDWELASTGSSLWDAARFTCYEKPDSRYWESNFIEGFGEYSKDSPDVWKTLLCAMNTISAAQTLATHSVREQFIPELKSLVHSGLRGKRIG